MTFVKPLFLFFMFVSIQLLSPQKSKAIMERLKQSVDPTDILERHNAVLESVTESPPTKGNKITLLANGQGRVR